MLRLTVIAYAFPIGFLYLDYSTTNFYAGKLVAFQPAASSQKFVRFIFVLLLIIWLAGICIYSIRLLWGKVKIEKALLFGSELGGEEKNVLENVKENIGYNKAVKVYKWPFSSTPMVVHGNRILLPLNITDSDTLRICLTHELNHVAARDLLWSSVC
ncbi:MAG: hypothetical protein LUH07_10000, partial [Lachnospiraceae bacterium]|nr:hypothetical protein [Lachnospiraceae bacterium]